MLKVIELATHENFSEEGYLMLNKDLREFANNGGDAKQHLKEHGIGEKRKQICNSFFQERRGSYSSLKYKKFFKTIEIDNSASRISFLENEASFPIALSDEHYSIDSYTAESANGGYMPFINEMEENPDGLYLDIGSGLRHEVYENCLYLEVYPSVTADIIVPPTCTYPLKSNSFDGIGCFAVLEHVTKPWLVADEIFRLLKPGGLCYIDWPFLQPVHGYPSHFFNATRSGLELLFSEHFDILSLITEPSQTPDYTINWILGNFINQLPLQLQNKINNMTVRELIQARPSDDFWQEILENTSDEAISEFACGNTLIAQKKLV